MMRKMSIIAAVITLSFVVAIFAGSDRNSGVDTQGPKYAAASTTVPEMINYQGVLTDGDGSPLDATVSMVFTIYGSETAGTNLWSETHGSVTVVSGLFSVLLGSVTSLPNTIFNDPNRWLGLAVDGDQEMERDRLGSVPYAFTCGSNAGAGEDWGREGVTETLYEGSTMLTDKYINKTGPDYMTGFTLVTDPLFQVLIFSPPVPEPLLSEHL